MKIIEALRHSTPTYSFEFFPPKSSDGEKQLFQALGWLREIGPSFVSVTYGAGGSTRSKTHEWTIRIQRELGLTTMAHLTCAGHSVEELRTILKAYARDGVQNILALRGDPPGGQGEFQPTLGGFQHASQLIEFIRNEYPTLCVGAACHPEGHPESPGPESDWDHLAKKIHSGAHFLISQLFFENKHFFRMRDFLRSRRLEVPILAGLMPITNVGQIKRFTQLCGSHIPQPLLDRIEAVEEDPQWVFQRGLEHALLQARELLVHGVDGLHLYTLNKSPATRLLMMALEPNRFHF